MNKIILLTILGLLIAIMAQPIIERNINIKEPVIITSKRKPVYRGRYEHMYINQKCMVINWSYNAMYNTDSAYCVLSLDNL